MSNKKYNYLIDSIKGIACICVVFMHCEFPGVLGTLIQTMARFCVPFFFMVSGYYCLNSENKLNKKMVHILKLIVFAGIFYVIIELIHNAVFQDNTYYFGFVKRDVLVWLVFNEPIVIVGQLWFLFALFYDYISMFFICKLNAHKLMTFAVPLLIIAYIFLAQGCHLIGKSVPNYIYRNFLIEGMLFFYSGYLIHKNEDKLKFSNTLLITVLTFSTLLTVVERMLLGRDFGVNITTFPQVASLFLLGVNNPEVNIKALNSIGKKDSMMIYILHPMVWHLCVSIYAKTGLDTNTAAMYVMPLIVLAGAFGASRAYGKCISLINERKKMS